MVLTIEYPSSRSELYATGTAEGGIYFEIPAIFDKDGVCDQPATLQKVEETLVATYGARP